MIQKPTFDIHLKDTLFLYSGSIVTLGNITWVRLLWAWVKFRVGVYVMVDPL